MKNIEASGQLKRGDKVQITNLTQDGKEFTEGTAILKQKLIPQRFQEYWQVQFEDGTEANRWVRPEKKIVEAKQSEVKE